MTMLRGCVDLGMNSAYIASSSKAFTRQALPEWNDAERAKKAYEPFPAWVGPHGLWADGPAIYMGSADWQIHSSFYASSHAQCVHLTCVANCCFDHGNKTIVMGANAIHDYALRPYYWSEADVQNAYEAVSNGDVPASEVAALATVGRYQHDPANDRPGTAREKERCREIHDAWDELVASRLAFGIVDKRPFVWHPCQWGDNRMASSVTAIGAHECKYDRPNPLVYGGGEMHFPRETHPHGSGLCGQGFFAWRRNLDGALSSEDWRRVANAILNASNPVDRQLQGRPKRSNEAFDVRVLKTVTLARGKWWKPGKQNNPNAQLSGRECSKNYQISCWWISGAKPAETTSRLHFSYVLN